MEPSIKVQRLTYGSHWAQVARSEQRRAEVAAYENWDRPDLAAFTRELQITAERKRLIVRDYGGPHARMSAATGIVIPPDEISRLAETPTALHDYLFGRQEYREYVMQCAASIAPTAELDLSIPALLIANRIIRSRQLGSVCRALVHTRPAREPARCPRLIEAIHPRVLGYLTLEEAEDLRLVSRRTAATVGREMLITIDGVTYDLPLTTTAEDLRVAFGCQVVRRYSRMGPIVPEGRIAATMRPAQLYTE